MASYRYERDIDPKDIAPRREKQYTRKERWANWWDYNLKWVILIGIAVVFVAYNFIGQMRPNTPSFSSLGIGYMLHNCGYCFIFCFQPLFGNRRNRSSSDGRGRIRGRAQ